MITLVFAALALGFTFAIYLAAMVGRHSAVGVFTDGGRSLAPWTFIFGGAGVLLAGLGVHDHFLLTALNGLQYSHVALGLIIAALCGTVAYKRLWLFAAMSDMASPIELIGAYYESIAVRIALMAVTLLLAVPFAAYSLALAGDLLASITDGALLREQAIFLLALVLFLVSGLGGWRGLILVVAALSFLLFALLLFNATFIASALGAFEVLAKGAPAAQGVMADQIPGVIQYSAGVGKETASGGIWTTLAIISFAVSLLGITLSPAMGYFAVTVRARSAFAFTFVWMVAGLATGVLLIVAPLVGAEIGTSDPSALVSGAPGYAALLNRLVAVDKLGALCLVLMLLASLQIVVAFFAAAGGQILTLDLVCRYVLPDLGAGGRRLTARIVLAIVFAALALQAAFAPGSAAILGPVSLSLSAQLGPAYLGLLFAPWISRPAVLTGFIIGALFVIFTEPPGLITAAVLSLDLPWGRWPLTIHSAAWGLTFNMVACLLVSVFTAAGAGRAQRDRLHEALAGLPRLTTGAPALQTAKWSLTLIWTFFALGPGAILGNAFFSKPVFTDTDAKLSAPSLWVWQIAFWFIGVLLVWWLAYRSQLSIIAEQTWPRVELVPQASPFTQSRTPGWIALLIQRLTVRQGLDDRGRR
jgi:solute:Na+ symporter, SSS family